MLLWFKFAIGVLLLPLCLGLAQTLVQFLSAAAGADTLWAAVLSGAACWIVIFLSLPKPVWLYVLGHELTHAVWALLFGGSVKRLKVTSKGGHVVITKTNFVISLAPYFFPFYVCLLILIFGILRLFWNVRPLLPGFHLLLGAAYAFHFTFTGFILRTRQTDITENGWFFSLVIIWLGNAAFPLALLPFLIPNLSAALVLRSAALHTRETFGMVFHWFA